MKKKMFQVCSAPQSNCNLSCHRVLWILRRVLYVFNYEWKYCQAKDWRQ